MSKPIHRVTQLAITAEVADTEVQESPDSCWNTTAVVIGVDVATSKVILYLRHIVKHSLSHKLTSRCFG